MPLLEGDMKNVSCGCHRLTACSNTVEMADYGGDVGARKHGLKVVLSHAQCLGEVLIGGRRVAQEVLHDASQQRIRNGGGEAVLTCHAIG